MESYGNKNDNAMMDMLLRSQKTVCTVKTTKSGHRDRFEMDMLSRLQKIRQAKTGKKYRFTEASASKKEEEAKDHNQSRYHTNTSKSGPFGEYHGEESKPMDKNESSSDESDEQKEMSERPAIKYDIKKQIRQLNNSNYGNFEGVPR